MEQEEVMRRGPKPRPGALKALEGNPGKRKIPKELKLPVGMPTPPEHLNSYALEEWNRIVVALYNLGIMSEIDRALLAGYCDSYATWRHATEQMNILAAKGILGALLQVTQSKNIIQHSLVGIARTAKSDMIRYGAELGMGQSVRARIALEENKEVKSKFYGLLNVVK
jgi:P27 family predicted phage terminase small subunit